MKAERKNRPGGAGSQETKKLKNPYRNYTSTDMKILKKIQAEHGSTFLSNLAGRIASRMEGRVV